MSSDETFAKWKAARAKRLESVASLKGTKQAGEGDKKA